MPIAQPIGRALTSFLSDWEDEPDLPQPPAPDATPAPPAPWPQTYQPGRQPAGAPTAVVGTVPSDPPGIAREGPFCYLISVAQLLARIVPARRDGHARCHAGRRTAGVVRELRRGSLRR
jgi:hypothetical protein